MILRAVVIAALVVVAACGDAGGEATTTTTTESPASPEQDAVDAAVRSLEARLEADGFQPVPAGSAVGNDFEFTAACAEFSDALPTDGTPFSAHGVSAESGGYERPTGDPRAAVVNTGGFAGIADDEARLAATFELLRDERLLPCLEESLAPPPGPDGEELPFELVVERLPALGLGDESVGVRMRGSIAESPYPFIVELLLVRSGPAGVGLFTTTFDEAADVDRVALLELMLDEVAGSG